MFLSPLGHHYIWIRDKTQPIYQNWDLYEPDDTSGVDNCVQVHFESGRWHDESCVDALGFVCRVPLGETAS